MFICAARILSLFPEIFFRVAMPFVYQGTPWCEQELIAWQYWRQGSSKSVVVRGKSIYRAVIVLHLPNPVANKREIHTLHYLLDTSKLLYSWIERLAIEDSYEQMASSGLAGSLPRRGLPAR